MEKNTVTLEGAKLKKIVDENETAAHVMFWLAERKRFRSVTDISHMKNLIIRSGEKIVLEDYMNTWKELQNLGVGSIIYGRNGQTNRFKWNYSLTAVGQAAINGTNVEVKELRPASKKEPKRPIVTNKPADKPIVKAVTAVTPDPAPLPAPTPQPVKDDASINNILYIPLRENFIFDVKLPKLSPKEADMICDAIKRCV